MEIHYPGVRSPVQEQRARWERKRACTAQELLETERRYQEQLGLVATYFLGILKAKGTLRPPERQALFGSWELIYGASQELLPYLEGGCWGQGLEGFCRHLELYNQFAANSERSQTTLQEQLKKNKGFRRFVRLQESRPEFGGLQLQDLLPLPLQRLQQYENLVVALAENTGPNSPDHQQLTRAARLISETAQRVHTIGQKQKNDQHLRRVQALLSGRQAKGLTSGRWFLRQGWLLVVPPHGEPRPRMFFLFTDVLLMAKPRPPLHLLQSGTFACKALYPMAQCQLSRVFGHSGGPCGGLLSLHENSKGFSFSLDLSEPCAKRWSLSSCPSLMRSYCLCPQTRRSCHAGTTV
ncbi:rho guanine nucleotide exchange factor 39 isoform X1 [Trachypithecus francoisi]|uniref:rho guanine nucleotide exchange factor 39 isoform X1 n=1 Tax=Trachypithecus francoisi TaxID=54180 RepID=UPI00141B19DA|nr:rho guanine nucleotide exchange factor 39 isoform X1 [Trachypithecus francoisi]XP_033094046.1 rho guanine nucleotide exchange factor 39 isoform X1 [Trachypithecus francoisi]